MAEISLARELRRGPESQLSFCKTGLDAKVNRIFMDLVPRPGPSANRPLKAKSDGQSELDGNRYIIFIKFTFVIALF